MVNDSSGVLERTRSLVPYRWASKAVRSKRVLDLGSSTGYGANALLVGDPAQLIATDVQELSLRPTSGYGTGRVHLIVSDGQRLPIGDGVFDAVVCFEVIDHVPDPNLLLSEITRVITAEGVLLISTPNRKMRLMPWQRPWNPEHVREYTADGFADELSRHFSFVEMFGITGTDTARRFYVWSWRKAALRRLFRLPIGAGRRIAPDSAQSSYRAMTERKRAARAARILTDSSGSNSDPFWVSKDAGHQYLNFVAVCAGDRTTFSRALANLEST